MVADKVFGIFLAFIALTAFSVAVSKRAQTANVLDAILKGFQGVQATAISPVTK